MRRLVIVSLLFACGAAGAAEDQAPPDSGGPEVFPKAYNVLVERDPKGNSCFWVSTLRKYRSATIR